MLDTKFEATRTLHDEEQVIEELLEEAQIQQGAGELSELIREQGEIAHDLLTALKDISHN